MKIKADKRSRNTALTFNEFLLKNFSMDRIDFIPDLELSCNECNLDNPLKNTDDVLSFLVKFKADHLRDPKAIKSGVTGFILPVNGNYRHTKVKSSFSSIATNHYDLVLTKAELISLAKDLYNNPSSSEMKYSTDDVSDYLIRSRNQPEWITLLGSNDKKKWRGEVGKALKRKLVKTYGTIDKENISAALNIDKTDFERQVQGVMAYNGFNSSELRLLGTSVE